MAFAGSSRGLGPRSEASVDGDAGGVVAVDAEPPRARAVFAEVDLAEPVKAERVPPHGFGCGHCGGF